MMKRVLFLLALLASQHAYTWWDAGHLIVAEIAYQNLTPEKKEEADRLCEAFAPFYPKLSTFATAAIWADVIKEKERLPLFDRLHYINLPYDPDKILTNEKKELLKAAYEGNNVIWLIEKAKKTLNNNKANTFEKALMLYLLIHCVGDIHQPLHCATLFNNKFKNGDCAGNFFSLRGKWKNLHLLWDAGAGAFPQEVYLDHPFDFASIAATLMKEYPKKSFPKASTLSPKKWAQESFNLAVKTAYKIEPNTAPTVSYLETAQEVCRKQVVLAGYRLAEILNDSLTESSELLHSEKDQRSAN